MHGTWQTQGQEAASPKPPRPKQVPAAQLPPLVKGTEDVTAAAAAGGRAAAGLVPRRMASAVVQTTPRLLESPRLDLSLALTGAGLEWLFGSKWQWFAGSRGEGQLELCLDGSLRSPSAVCLCVALCARVRACVLVWCVYVTVSVRECVRSRSRARVWSHTSRAMSVVANSVSGSLWSQTLWASVCFSVWAREQGTAGAARTLVDGRAGAREPGVG